MCEPTTIAYGVLALSAVIQGYSSYEQGKFDEGVAKYNARQDENQATQTRNKSTEEENKQRRFTAELISKQKAEAAAGGVDINSGSALQLQTDSALLGEVDALRIRQNFGDAANSLDDRAGLTLAKGDNARKSGRNEFGASLISAAGQGVQGYNASVNPKWYTADSAITSNASGASASAQFGNIG